MHPPCDSSLDISANPFVIEPSSQLSYPPGFAEPLVPSNLKPYLGVFRVNPFTSHDGVHGRSVPTSARIHTHPEDIRPIILEFQLSLGSSPESSPESESYSEEVPMSVLPPPDPDVTIKPGPLRYLDGDTAPLTEFAEPPQTELETTTWSTAPLYHPYPSRQSFPQLDGARTSSPTYYAHSRTNDPDHPFTRVDRTPEPEAASFRPVTLTYPPSLAYHTQQAGSRSESMYASESTSEVGQESSDGYRFEYSSSDGLGGYSITHAPTAGSHFYPQDNSYFQAQQPSFSFARSDVSSQHTLFATPAQMAIPSHQEGVYPSSDSDLSPSPYPSGNLDSTNDHSLDRPTPPSFQPQLPADHCYVHDSTQLRDSNRYDFLAAQSDARTREIKFSTSPHQAHLGPIRHPSLPNSYDSYSRESHFQITPRGYDQLASRGYRHDASGSEQPMSEPQHNSRSPSLLDRGTSFLLDRPVSRTDSSVFENPRPDAFSHTGARTLDPSSSPPLRV
ncbi:hypothetical protein OPQ81_009906 [Rhizoctonia solani]|nr:hypothetical protein OPQ81_009906 [Rhizoctonia solani]